MSQASVVFAHFSNYTEKDSCKYILRAHVQLRATYISAQRAFPGPVSIALAPLPRTRQRKISYSSRGGSPHGRYGRFLIDSDLRWQPFHVQQSVLSSDHRHKKFRTASDEREGSERDNGHRLRARRVGVAS